jgi:hypothetical protein
MRHPLSAVIAGVIFGGGFSLAFVESLAQYPNQHSGTQPVTVHTLRSW